MVDRWLACVVVGGVAVAGCVGGDSTQTGVGAPTESELPENDPGALTSTTATVLPSPDVVTSELPTDEETAPDEAPYEVAIEQSSSAGRWTPERVDLSLGVLGEAPTYAWRTAAQDGFVGSVDVVDSVVVAALIDDAGSTTILGLDQPTGDVRWARSIDANQTATVHAIRDALVVVSVENRGAASMTRLDPATGEGLWVQEVSAEPRLEVRSQYGSLFQFDPETEEFNVFDIDSGQVAIRADSGLAANMGWVVRNDQSAQVVDFQSFEPIGAAITLSPLHDSTSTLGVIVANQVVQSIDNAIVIFDSTGREVGRTGEILNSPGAARVAFSESLVLFTQNGASTVVDVSAEPEAVWATDLRPVVLGADGGSIYAYVSELPPSGGQRTALVDLSSGVEVCALDTDDAVEAFQDGFFADATAFGLDCEPRWSIDLPADERVIVHDGGVLIIDEGAEPTWSYYQSSRL